MTQKLVESDTRERFISAATRLFADKGFYGASMDQIAREVGLTKQALIHHFGTKEKLYGAVLANISDRLLDALGGKSVTTSRDAFAGAVVGIYERALARPLDTQLLMRELLDNRPRADEAGTWYLRPFLDRLHELLRQEEKWRAVDDVLIATHVYQILGAINYFAVSAPTLQKMYSARHLRDMRATFPERLRHMAAASPDIVQ